MKGYMIGFAVSRNGLTSEIKCPCDEKDISRVQDDLDIPYNTDTRVTVVGVDSDIEQLSVLEGQEIDLDFLNLLGRLMYGMDVGEYEQFRIGLYYECPSALKDIINIAVSTSRYSIIDPNDLHKSGLDHECDVRGGIPTSEVDITDYSTIGKQLLESGKCQKTPYGLLYVNEENPVESFFDGKHMPAYYDCDFEVAVALVDGENEDFVFLPCSDAELQRSANRLGASFPYDLKVRIDDTPYHNNDLIYGLMKKADVYTLNKFARLIDGFDDDENEKYISVVSYVDRMFKDFGGLGSLDAATKLGGVLDAFTYIPEAKDDYELGHSIFSEHLVDEELEPYVDFARLGEDTRNNENGDFSDNGYIGLNDGEALRTQMAQKHSDGMGGLT